MTTESHHKAFITYRRAGCSCGHIMEAVSRKEAGQKLIAHLLHPASANKIADTPAEHAPCNVEAWNDRWGICQDHLVYVDLGAAEPRDNGTQTEMELSA